MLYWNSLGQCFFAGQAVDPQAESISWPTPGQNRLWVPSTVESGTHCLSLVLTPGPPQVTVQVVQADHSFHSAVAEAGVVVDTLGRGQVLALHTSCSVPSPAHVLVTSTPGLHSPDLVLSPPPQVTVQSLHSVQQLHSALVFSPAKKQPRMNQ